MDLATNIDKPNIGVDGFCSQTANVPEYAKNCEMIRNDENNLNHHVKGKTLRNKANEKFACKLCNIEVTSATNLESHYNGMAHIKRSRLAGAIEENQRQIYDLEKFKDNCLRNHQKGWKDGSMIEICNA